ncbi:MAG TPA: sialidase family protein [Kiritimatiellia bacterium]|nr:sialidase family protein [Kiritimatiellia bacterium]
MSRLWVVLLLVVAVLWIGGVLFLTGCATTMSFRTVGLRVKKGKPFIIAHSEKAQGWGFLSHPFLNHVDGHVVVFYNLGGDTPTPSTPGELLEKGPALLRLGATNWAYGSSGMGVMTQFCWSGLINRGDGAVTYVPFPQMNVNESFEFTSDLYVNSRHVGGPWGSAVEVKGAQGAVTLTTRGCVDSNGTLLVVGFVDFPTPGYKRSWGEAEYGTFLLASEDGGRTWTYRSTVARKKDAPWGVEGPCEPALVVLPNGELLCLMRTGSPMPTAGPTVSSSMLLARSRDGGRTWAYDKMLIPGVMPKLLQMSNGVLVCAFGRPGNNLIFSLDGGHSWGHEVSLTRADLKTTGYCDFAEVATNRLLVVYDSFDTTLSNFWLWDPPKPINGVFGMYVDVIR